MSHFLRATKGNDVFFAFVHPNYASYITVYLLMLMILEESHPEANSLLLGNGFNVNRSDVPRSRSAVDMTIEQTINRHAELQGGIIYFSRNHSAHYRCAKPGRPEQVLFKQQERWLTWIIRCVQCTFMERRFSQFITREKEIYKVNYRCYLSVLFSDLWLVMRYVRQIMARNLLSLSLIHI